MCAQCITEVIVSGMRTYIRHTVSTPHDKKLWFNHVCSHAIKDREIDYKRYMSPSTPETHTLYISARNCAKSILRLTKTLSSIENVKTLSTPIPLKISGISPKLFLTTILLPLSHLSAILTAALLSPLFLKLNSLLILSLQTPLWTIQSMFLQLIPPLTHLCLLSKILKNDVFYVLSGLNTQKAYGPDGVPPIVPKNCAPVLTPCLVKHFRLCLSTSTFPSCRKYAYIQHVPKKGDRSNSTNYRPIALLSCLSKAFETILNKWFLKHLSSLNLLSDRQYGFRKERSTGDLLAFPTNSWSSSFSRFGETFAVDLDISKAFDRVWHKS